MTHDELLGHLTSKLNTPCDEQGDGCAYITYCKDKKREGEDRCNYCIPWFALRAVVELHKPQEITLPDGSWGQNCKECDNNWDDCSTIQAIKSVLL